jgi:hypothetical protein
MKDYKDLKCISYCALYCGNCFLRIGDIADLSQQLLKRFRQIKFEKWAKGLAGISKELKAFEKYESCYEVLKAWDGMRCTKICKEGGGSTSCKIRICCQKKNIEGCWECEYFKNCDTLAWLVPVNGEVNVNHIKKIIAKGMDKFIEEIRDKEYGDFYETKK